MNFRKAFLFLFFIPTMLLSQPIKLAPADVLKKRIEDKGHRSLASRLDYSSFANKEMNWMAAETLFKKAIKECPPTDEEKADAEKTGRQFHTSDYYFKIMIEEYPEALHEFEQLHISEDEVALMREMLEKNEDTK